MFTRILLSGAMVVLTMTVTAESSVADDAVLDAFVGACRKDKNINEEQRKQVLDLIQRERRDDRGRSSAITTALQMLHADYQTALVALANEQFDVAIVKLGELTKSENRFLADDAKYFLAQAHMNQENYEEAIPLLDSLTNASDSAMTLHKGDAMFMRGVCQSHLLKRKQAIASLKRFLAENPKAAERLRVGAEHQIAVLEQRTDGSLLDVKDRMEFSGRRLTLEDSGRETRHQQDQIIAMLDALIDEAEDRERPPANQPPGPPEPDKPTPGPAKPDPNGPGRPDDTDNPDDSDEPVLRRKFGDHRSSWDPKRKQEYEKVLSALKAKYPGGRYAKLAEEYRRTLREER